MFHGDAESPARGSTARFKTWFSLVITGFLCFLKPQLIGKWSAAVACSPWQDFSYLRTTKSGFGVPLPAWGSGGGGISFPYTGRLACLTASLLLVGKYPALCHQIQSSIPRQKLCVLGHWGTTAGHAGTLRDHSRAPCLCWGLPLCHPSEQLRAALLQTPYLSRAFYHSRPQESTLFKSTPEQLCRQSASKRREATSPSFSPSHHVNTHTYTYSRTQRNQTSTQTQKTLKSRASYRPILLAL